MNRTEAESTERSGATQWVSCWLIERPSDEPGRPRYWVDSGEIKGVGSWTKDAWEATRFESKEHAERVIHRWVVHPTVIEAKAVSHGFEGVRDA